MGTRTVLRWTLKMRASGLVTFLDGLVEGLQGEGGTKNDFDRELFPQWMDLDCSQENHGVPHYTVCEKIVQA